MTPRPAMFSRPRLCPSVAALVLAALVSGCSYADGALPPTRDQIVELYEQAGYSPVVAECIVGTAERSLEIDQLAPNADRVGPDAVLVDEAIVNCEAASDLLNAEPDEPEQLAYDAGSNGYGSDPGFDALWDACAEGDGSACDELWQTAPVGSVYEEFGVTCGRRLEILDCSKELVIDDDTSGDETATDTSDS